MNRWLDKAFADRLYMVNSVADNLKIEPASVEKDWWVTAILKVLFSLTPSQYMYFKGGTSLSKGWNLINRFSEDIDIALYREFYLNVLGKECANAETNNQVKKLRVVNRDYIHGEFIQEFREKLIKSGLSNCQVVPETHKANGEPIDHDSDPVVINVIYQSLYEKIGYTRPVVKIEVSCLSMKEPFEKKNITSLIRNFFSEHDEWTQTEIQTITPARTFLEKAFLLNEEYQRKNPRTLRMSRHLYDLERLMDTDYAILALSDRDLYKSIIEHRKRFYHVGGVDYSKNMPELISFCPNGKIKELLKDDYKEMKDSMIYGDKLSFETLIERLEILQARFRQI